MPPPPDFHRAKPPACSGCPLLHHGQDFTQIEGLGSLGVMIVGEASGEGEAREQLPFRPWMPAGSVLERTIQRLGYSRSQFSVTNIVRCRPANNLLEGMPFAAEAIAHCSSNLHQALAKFRPRVILALGNIALRSTTGLHGEKLTVSHLRGYGIRATPELCQAAGNMDLVVVPSYHPSFLRRGAIHLSGVLARDLQRSVMIAQGKDKSFILDPPEDPSIPEYIWASATADEDFDCTAARIKSEQDRYLSYWLETNQLRYNLHPTPKDLDLFCRDAKARSDAWLALTPDARRGSDTALCLDLETAESQNLDEDATDGYTDTIIEQIQFSLEPNQAIVFPWNFPDIHQATHWLLALPLPKLNQNLWLFEEKVMRAVAQRDFGSSSYFHFAGDKYDTLQMFHYWQPDVPANLQFAASFCQFPFPWKHLSGSNLALYGAPDVDAPHRLFRVIKRTMMDRGIWDDPDLTRSATGYLNQTQAVRPILAEMEDRGLPIDNPRRLALDKEFDLAAAEVFRDLNQMFPDEARKVQPKEGHKSIPPRVKKFLATGLSPIEVKSQIVQMPAKKTKKGEKPGECFHFELRHVSQDGTLPPRWFKVFDFSPNSSQQILKYMRCRRHKVPTKKGGAETSDKKELERLAAKHSDNFYFKVIEYRELTKMRGTYIDGYRPQADGRVHTTFTFATGTQQLSSRNPNCQNVPKNGKLADSFRAIIRHPEKLIVEWDYKSFHVLTTGFEAKTPEYMRLARLDMHSFIAWHFLQLPGADELYSLPDDELAEKLAWFKTDKKRKYVRDKQAKPCIAEGELVLTDKGLVPIERITLAHRVWDGIEWVSHAGLVYQGVKEVITYDGLTATKCHKVVTRDGDQIPFGEAASRMVKLESTGSGRQAIRTRYRDKLEASARERILARAREVWGLSDQENYRPVQPSSWEHDRMPKLRAEEVYSSDGLRTSLRCCSESLSEHVGPSVQVLWRSGDSLRVQKSSELCELGGRALASSRLQGSGDRSKGQRRKLCTREFETVFAGGAASKPAEHSLGITSRSEIFGGRLAEPLQFGSYSCMGFEGANRRADYRGGERGRLGSKEELQGNRKKTSFSRVYDIADAGPRKCYTVSGKLVANCILGIGFGLGVEKMYNMNLEHFKNLQEAKKLKDMIQGIFPRVFKWQDEVRDLAHRQTYLRSRFGSIRWFFEVKVPDGKGGMKYGEQSEQAIAFLPATHAFGHIRCAMKELNNQGLAKRWNLVNTVHDSLIFLVHPSQMDEHVSQVHPILVAPSKVLIDPVLAPQGLAVDVECSAGISWAKSDLKDIPLPKLILA